MTINLHLPNVTDTLRPKLTVVGVGGAGGNAVNNMIAANLEGVDFIMANTDAQALDSAATDRVVQLGVGVTRGLGAGASPAVGRAAAEEAIDDIADLIEGSNMVFITAGMGGGTGTGAAPVIAELAKEQGILTVGVVTKPFHFEGTHRMRIADAGIEELQSIVDTLIVIPNQNLFRIANEKTTFADAFRMADEVLHSGVRGVTDLMVKPGRVNLDFADIRAVMSEMGKAMMGTGEAQGDKRAIDAAEAAISNPLLDDVSLNGARAVLINITGGPDMTLFEVDEAANRIRDEVDANANIIFGSTFSDALEGTMRVSVVATGIEAEASVAPRPVTVPQASSFGTEKKKVVSAFSAPKPVTSEPKRERSPADIVRESATVASGSGLRARLAEKSEAKAETPAAVKAEVPAEPKRDEKVTAIPTIPLKRPVIDEHGQGQLDIEAMVQEQEEAAEKAATVSAPFISPRAEHPKRQPQVSEPVAELEEEEYEDEEESSFSFFERIAGVGKALAAKPEPKRPSSRAQVSERPMAVGDEDEEHLDIPAFLRRQAN